MALYKAVGEVVRSAGLASDVSASTVSGFCHLSSYNAIRERHFQPWIEIFAASNNLMVYKQIGEALDERVKAKKRSTYDHLLRTLCRADSSLASAVLHTLVAFFPPPQSEMIPKPPLFKMGLANGMMYGAIGVASQVATSGVEGLLGAQGLGTAIGEALVSPVVWGIGASLGALAGMIRATDAFLAHAERVELNDKRRAHCKSSHFLFFAEMVYARLGEAAPQNRYASELRQNMANCGLYESVISSWSTSYPIRDSTRRAEDVVGNGAS
jgi:hypothetical protein